MGVFKKSSEVESKLDFYAVSTRLCFMYWVCAFKIVGSCATINVHVRVMSIKKWKGESLDSQLVPKLNNIMLTFGREWYSNNKVTFSTISSNTSDNWNFLYIIFFCRINLFFKYELSWNNIIFLLVTHFWWFIKSHAFGLSCWLVLHPAFAF